VPRSDFDKYDVFMKILEIIEQDGAVASGSVSDERITKITNIIQRLEGDIVQTEFHKEVIVEGDNFENINQSVIATRGSIAHGIIQVRSRRGNDVADALQELESALSDAPPALLADRQRKEALELLAEIAQQSAKPEVSKSVLKSVGDAFWKIVENAEPISKACLGAWKSIETVWK
jgi:hypothetical protein